jgi:hypothetical protein
MWEVVAVKTLRAGERVWLILDDAATRIRFQIEYRLAVNQRTHESVMMYRVDHWTLKRADRWPLGYYDELQQALDACELALGMPSFIVPVTAPDGTILTPEEQRARWRAGLDPRTGTPRAARALSSAG